MHSSRYDTKMPPSKSRHNKSDLIDLSNEVDDVSCNNILDLFDPLNEIKANEQQQHQSKKDAIARSNTSARLTARPIELRCRDRRQRATSACYIKPSHITNEFGLSSFKKGTPSEQVYITGDGSIKSQCSANLTPPSSKSESSPSDRESLGRDLDGMSIRSSRSSNDISGLSHSDSLDLKGPNDHVVVGDGDDLANKLRLARKLQRSGKEILLLTEKIKSFRGHFKHHDRKTNSGIVYSPTLYSCIKVLDMSVKLIISSPLANEPISFTCNVSTSVEHLISHAVCSMFENLKEDDSMDNYILKVAGKDEYFDSKLCLVDYALVTHCWKFDLDVKLTLVRLDAIKRPFERTSKDDFRCKSLLCADDLLSRTAILKYSDLNYEALNITIETFEREAQRLYSDVTNKSTSLQTQSLLQTTKAICSLMMNCETSQLSDSKDNLAELCRSYKSEGDRLANEDRYKMIEVIQHAIKRLVGNMRRLLRLTSVSLPVDYEVIDGSTGSTLTRQKQSFVDSPIDTIRDQVTLRVHLISQLKPDWLAKYQDFHLSIGLAYGDRELCEEVLSSKIRADKSFFQRLLFDEDIILPITYSNLPREARFVITLHGTETLPVVGTSSGNYLTVSDEPSQLRRSVSSTSICSTAPMYSSSPKSALTSNQKQSLEHVQVLAKTIAYIFDQENFLYQGDRLVYMHPISDNFAGDLYVETIAERNDPILVLEYKTFPPEKKIYFPDVSVYRASDPRTEQKKFDDLDAGVKFVLNSIIFEKRSHERLMDDERTLLWDNREYLTSIPCALSKVLISVPSWSPANLKLIYSVLEKWTPLEAVDALQLLLPSFPDTLVRKYAVEWIAQQKDDELCDYLPQLLQAFRYEKSIDCPLFWLLLERALENVRIASLLYWQLKISSNDKMIEERSETLINCLLWNCGSAFWKFVDKQNELLSKLTVVSNDIKKVRDNQRMSVLHRKLEHIQDYLMEEKPAMPWAPSLEICDIDIRSCSYFPSNTLPLKLAFRSCEESCRKQIKFYSYDTIFKMGDDLRQDMLAIQIIRIMEKLWLREGLDLRIVTFDCLATGDRQGMVEVVQNAETLRKIHQNSSFLTGPFIPKAIDNYIRLWNTSELEYKTALDNFLHSCAGYSVATYILGICDRHNDNIMITNSGHLFHIDFGKFLGDSQMLGSIKRDRTPFVLTADMAYVINGGDRPTKKFQTFIELCTMGFNIIRRHRNLFLNLFSLMSSAKIHGLDAESVNYIDKMLMPNLTEAEAMAKFTRLIDECLNSRSTQVNFFIHNLAQLRFSNDNSKQTLLSFVPKTFTMQTDGQIESLEVVRLFKLYEPEKQYYYVVKVKRFDQPDPVEITRTFREFSELQMKLNCMFPSSNFHDINKSTSSFLMDFVGRNNTREIAERRLVELRTFLRKLLSLPPEISQCDLIYTFFHPILRDQTTNNGDMSSINVSSSSSTFGSQEYNEAQRNALYRDAKGQVKLKLSYKNSTLIIMMMHAKNLPQIYGDSSPNCYAKTYLLPDPHKQTKRKTRVVRQNCNPSFMELIVYNIPLESLKRLTLQVSIWHSEIVQTKAFVGAAYIPLGDVDLSKETTSWYPLKGY
uniref:Phosphatidylinositol 4-phosphate 3-kinase C2 domain-containing subunit alpha n=1 Tax=Aceria tosichella TaxID=561515 RepID=A0A6G1SG77_9ACAR